jgi:transcriptional regulator with XRE-family HTH domain
VKKYKTNDQIIISIGKRIRKRRNALGWTMMDLAFEADMDYRQIGRIERGETNFTIGTLVRIAVVLDVSLKDLMK